MLPAVEPKISLIVPILNEEESLPAFFENLAKQRDLVFEVVFCDGNSTDGTLSLLSSCKPSFLMQIVQAEKGRGRQMNQGAHYARSDNLIFLHADSIFEEPLALRRAVDAFELNIEKTGSERLAGHFPCVFYGPIPDRPWVIIFTSAKPV